MDSNILGSSYRRYKEDTNAFMMWLLEKAAVCGYRPLETSKPNQPVCATETPYNVPLTLAEKLREKAAKKALKREEKALLAENKG